MKYIALFAISISICVSPVFGESPNMLINGSMEYWHPSGLRPQDWGVWSPDASRTSWQVSRDDQMVRDGRASMHIDVSDWVNVFAGAKVQPQRTYTYSVYVRCDKPVKVGMKLSVPGVDVAGDDRDKNRKKPIFDITPGTWQRISVTDTMPAGAQRVTAYLLLRGAGIYHLDMGMFNPGELTDYVPGNFYRPLTPLLRAQLPGEAIFAPQRWNADGDLIDDQEVAFAFDSDVMSNYRLRHLPGYVGATFNMPVMLRGLALLLDQADVPEDVTLTVQVQRKGKWTDVQHQRTAVGVVNLLAFDAVSVDAVRIHFNSQRKLMRIYHIGFAQ